MQIRSVMTSYWLQLKSGEYLVNDISGNVEAVFLETWHHKCASQKKQNDTLSAVAIAAISSPVSFCQNTKFPHLEPLKWVKLKGPTWNRHSSYIALTSIIRLGEVAGFCFKTKLRIFVFINTLPVPKLCHGNSTKGVILFLLWWHLWCQVSRTLLRHFHRYRLFSIFHF